MNTTTTARVITGIRELRTARGSLRSDTIAGQNVLSGYAANYNVLSSDLGGWKERIMPGAFARAIQEKQDVRYLINHDPNKVIGRTKSGTLTLSTDQRGLAFRCTLPDTSYARDLAVSVNRGDVNECSFGFVTTDQNWANEPDPDTGEECCIRELRDVDLHDISTVTYPAYPGTATYLGVRTLFPAGVPPEVRDNVRKLRGYDMQTDEWYKARARQILLSLEVGI